MLCYVMADNTDSQSQERKKREICEYLQNRDFTGKTNSNKAVNKQPMSNENQT